MKVDLSIVPKLGVSPNQLYLLHCLQSGMAPVCKIPEREITALIELGYICDDRITTQGSEIIARALFRSKSKSTKRQLTEQDMTFVARYRELWPPGRLPNNTMARSSVKELASKFEVFFNQYPDYFKHWDLILQATAIYLDEAEQRQFDFSNNSETFIYKMDSYKVMKSSLAKYCQLVNEGALAETMAHPSLITIPGL